MRSYDDLPSLTKHLPDDIPFAGAVKESMRKWTQIAIRCNAKRRLTFKPRMLYPPYKREAHSMQAYCFKCRRKVEIKNPVKVELKNKRPATRGICPNCGTKVFRIGKG